MIINSFPYDLGLLSNLIAKLFIYHLDLIEEDLSSFELEVVHDLASCGSVHHSVVLLILLHIDFMEAFDVIGG